MNYPDSRKIVIGDRLKVREGLATARNRQSAMPYGHKIVLHCPTGYHEGLDQMVEQFIQDEAVFVGVVGEDCSKIEDTIDELLARSGSDQRRLILTSSHPGESLAEAVEFALSLTGEYAGEVQVVLL
jgi:hypothetical protein